MTYVNKSCYCAIEPYHFHFYFLEDRERTKKNSGKNETITTKWCWCCMMLALVNQEINLQCSTVTSLPERKMTRFNGDFWYSIAIQCQSVCITVFFLNCCNCKNRLWEENIYYTDCISPTSFEIWYLILWPIFKYATECVRVCVNCKLLDDNVCDSVLVFNVMWTIWNIALKSTHKNNSIKMIR